MKETVIAVVGGGATAVSLIDSLVREAKTAPGCPRLVVYTIDNRRLRGRGLAYDDDVASNLLNTRAGFITPFPDRPGHFFTWLRENGAVWRHEFPDLVVEPETFVPRPLFGLYLECMLSALGGELLRIGGSLVSVGAEAIDIERTADGRFVVGTDTALTIRADHVVLSCGNLQVDEHEALAKRPGFHASPYPIRRMVHEIARDARVAVIGARLSAIDAIMGLFAAGHRGPIAMVSRSGYLPSVRGTQGRYAPTLLTRAHVEAHVLRHGGLSLATLVGWVEEEIARAGGGRLQAGTPIPPRPPSDPLAFLESEIAQAQAPRPWQAVLYATNGIVDLLWRALPEAERLLFLDRFQAAWMAYRVSIPVENARRMLDAGREGRLGFRSGASHVAARGDGGFDVAIGEGPDARVERFDAVVCAYGSSRDPRRLASRLVQSLIARGLVRPHRHGGLDVATGSGAAIAADGSVVRNLSILGELTAGANFFTSALEINARHAAAAAKAVIASIAVDPNDDATPILASAPRLVGGRAS